MHLKKEGPLGPFRSLVNRKMERLEKTLRQHKPRQLAPIKTHVDHMLRDLEEDVRSFYFDEGTGGRASVLENIGHYSKAHEFLTAIAQDKAIFRAVQRITYESSHARRIEPEQKELLLQQIYERHGGLLGTTSLDLEAGGGDTQRIWSVADWLFRRKAAIGALFHGKY